MFNKFFNKDKSNNNRQNNVNNRNYNRRNYNYNNQYNNRQINQKNYYQYRRNNQNQYNNGYYNQNNRRIYNNKNVNNNQNNNSNTYRNNTQSRRKSSSTLNSLSYQLPRNNNNNNTQIKHNTQQKATQNGNNDFIQKGLNVNNYIHKKHYGNSVMNNGSLFSQLWSRLMHKQRYQQKQSALYKQYNSQQFNHTTIEHLAYKGLTHDDKVHGYFDNNRHYLILANDFHDTDGYADMIRVGGTSLSDLPPRLVLERMSMFIHFLRADLSDINFISLPLPNDSRVQQHQWRKVLDGVQDKLVNPNLNQHKRKQLISRQNMIIDKLRKFKLTDRNLINQGFVMMIYKMGNGGIKTIRALDDEVRLAYRFGGEALNLSPMSEHQKEVFLRHLNNPIDVRTM